MAKKAKKAITKGTEENIVGIFSEERKLSIHNNKWVLSIAINTLVIAVVIMAMPMMYESNDDFAIAAELADGYPYISFVNYYLCRILIVIQDIAKDINIFVLSQIVMSFLAFCGIMKVVLERSKSKIEIIFAALICMLFSLDHYCDIQFTKTAALLMTSGLLLLIDNYINERKWSIFIIASVLFFIGAGYRDNGLLPASAYAGIFLILWLFIEKRKINIKDIAVLALIAVIIIAPHGFDAMSDAMNRSTPELKLCREYQSARVRITDYPLMGYYEQAIDQYDDLNISENDLSLLNKWFFDYEGAASLDNLKRINTVNKHYVESNRSIWKAFKKAVVYALQSVVSFNMSGIHIIIVILLLLSVILTAERRYRIYAIAIGALTICIYVTIFYMQRAQYRALYLADAGAVFWTLYVMISNKKEEKDKARKLICMIGIIASIAMLIPAYQLLTASKEFSKNLVGDEVFTQYFSDHKENLYIVPARTMSQPKEYIEPLSVPKLTDNTAGTGGWETLTPYELTRLEKYGVYNPMKDMINNEKVLYFGENIKEEQKALTEYYRKWYCEDGRDVRFEMVDEVNGVGIYNVVIK